MFTLHNQMSANGNSSLSSAEFCSFCVTPQCLFIVCEPQQSVHALSTFHCSLIKFICSYSVPHHTKSDLVPESVAAGYQPIWFPTPGINFISRICLFYRSLSGMTVLFGIIFMEAYWLKTVERAQTQAVINLKVRIWEFAGSGFRHRSLFLFQLSFSLRRIQSAVSETCRYEGHWLDLLSNKTNLGSVKLQIDQTWSVQTR